MWLLSLSTTVCHTKLFLSGYTTCSIRHSLGLQSCAEQLTPWSSAQAFMYLYSCMEDSIFKTCLDGDGGGGFSSPWCSHLGRVRSLSQAPVARQLLASEECLLPPTVTVALWRRVIYMNSIIHFPYSVLWRNANSKTLDLLRGGRAITSASFHMLLTKKCRGQCRIQILSEQQSLLLLLSEWNYCSYIVDKWSTTNTLCGGCKSSEDAPQQLNKRLELQLIPTMWAG